MALQDMRGRIARRRDVKSAASAVMNDKVAGTRIRRAGAALRARLGRTIAAPRNLLARKLLRKRRQARATGELQRVHVRKQPVRTK